jgi:hypothetical protein
VVCERERVARELRVGDAGCGHRSRRDEFAERIFVGDSQPDGSKDQLRLNAQYRQDYFQVPYDPDASDYECTSDYYCSAGLRDAQTERDAFVIGLGSYDFAESGDFCGAVLPLQPGELRFGCERRSGCDDVAPDFAITWVRRRMRIECWAERFSRRGSTRFIRGERFVWRCGERRQARRQDRPNTTGSAQRRGWWSFILPTICGLGRYM